MAKDNVPFHSIFWPSVLFASDLGYKQVDYIKGFHWLTYNKGKFSTTQKRGIFTDSALNLYPADYWRYYLISHCPETADSDFCFTHFASVINKDLADILGNFCNRTLSLVQKYYNSTIPLYLKEEEQDKKLIDKASHLVDSMRKNLSTLKFRNATQDLRALWVLGNEYITQEQPWVTIKTNPHAAAVSLVHCVYLLRLFAITSYPFIPYTSQKILELLNDSSSSRIQTLSFTEGLNFNFFIKNHNLSGPEKLFMKIEDSTIQNLISEFSGISSD